MGKEEEIKKTFGELVESMRKEGESDQKIGAMIEEHIQAQGQGEKGSGNNTTSKTNLDEITNIINNTAAGGGNGGGGNGDDQSKAVHAAGREPAPGASTEEVAKALLMLTAGEVLLQEGIFNSLQDTTPPGNDGGQVLTGNNITSAEPDAEG